MLKCYQNTIFIEVILLSVNSPDLLLEITLGSFTLCFWGVLIISAVVYFKQQYYYKHCASECELTCWNCGFNIYVISVYGICSPLAEEFIVNFTSANCSSVSNFSFLLNIKLLSKIYISCSSSAFIGKTIFGKLLKGHRVMTVKGMLQITSHYSVLLKYLPVLLKAEQKLDTKDLFVNSLFSRVDCCLYVRILLLMWHTIFITIYFIEVQY